MLNSKENHKKIYFNVYIYRDMYCFLKSERHQPRFGRKSKKVMEILPRPEIQKFRCSQVLLKLEPGDQVKLELFPLTLSLSPGKCVRVRVCVCVCVCVSSECLFVALDGRGPGPEKKEALSHQKQKKSKASPGKFSSQIL